MADTTFCDSDVPDYVARECGNDYAGIVGIGLVMTTEEVTQTDLEDADWWASALVNDTPQTVFVIPNTRGEYTSASPTEEDGFGLESTRVTGADHSAVVEVEGLSDNRDFWEGVNRRKWYVALVTAGGLLYWVEIPCSVYARINNQRSIKGLAFWSIDIKWQSFSNPEVFTAPEGVFTV
jgi:hypothetical protein